MHAHGTQTTLDGHIPCISNCAGLARLEARIVAEEMGRRLESIEVSNSDQLRYHPSFVLRGLQRLDVTVSAKEVPDHG